MWIPYFLLHCTALHCIITLYHTTPHIFKLKYNLILKCNVMLWRHRQTAILSLLQLTMLWCLKCIRHTDCDLSTTSDRKSYNYSKQYVLDWLFLLFLLLNYDWLVDLLHVMCVVVVINFWIKSCPLLFKQMVLLSLAYGRLYRAI